jgi:ligand-binding sensor domain-containing protein/signal transduction histidine kinase
MFMRILPESGFCPKRLGQVLAQFQISLFLFLALNNSSGRDFSPLAQYQSTIWRVEDGLPQSTVTCMAQSSDGYLWLGTQNGLVRFDGVKFRVFDENNTPAIKNSRIVQLLSDQDGTLWVGTEHGGLVCLRRGQFTSYEVPGRGTTHNYARVFCDDRQGALWQVSCEWQLIKFLQGQFTVFSDSWNLSSQAARALACDVEGQIWVGTDSELAIRQDGQFQPVWGRTNEENFQVDFLSRSRGGGIWVAANGRLRKFEGRKQTMDLGAYRWTNRRIYDLCEDRENRIWVATLGGGLFRYDLKGEVLHLTSQNGLPTDNVRCVMEDREGNIWVGTEGGGLCRLKQSIFQTYGVKEGLASDQVMAVAEARDGGLWISTDGDGLDHWKDDKVSHYGFNEGLRNGNVWSVVQDRNGVVWAGTWDGLYELDDGKFSGLSDGQTIGWQVLAMYEDAAGNLWLGQQAFGGITRLRNAERTVVKIPGTSANLDVRCFAEDHDGNLWVGTSEDGLYRIKGGKFTHFGREDGLGSDSIWCLYVDEQGALWTGACRGGLSLWQNGHFINWSTRNGLINNVICQIQEDARGNLWLGSYGGVFRINKQELKQSASEPDRAVHCVGYSLEDGLPSLECQGGFQPSGYKSRDGRLWFPTIKGLVVVDPGKVSRNSLPPAVVIEDVIVDGTSISATGEPGKSSVGLSAKTSIPPGNKRIEFQYTALSLSAPNGAHFKYRLEGLEKDWEDAGTKRAAVYSHVPPGSYDFHVIACNGEGVWNETGATLAVAISPYFWETKWFLALNVLAGLVAVASLARYVESRTMRRRLDQAERERAIEKERARIAKDIHDEFGASLTEITLLSEFAQEPTASPTQVQADMQKITAKARNLTQMMDEVVWAVSPQNDILEKFVTYTCSFAEEYLQTAKVACRLEVPEFLPEIILTADVRHNLFLVVKEALHNIVKHAAASEARIQVALAAGMLILTIQDNGKGFLQDSASVGGPNVAAGCQRDGLSNMRRRIESIAGRIELESPLGSGTCVKLMITLDNPTPPSEVGHASALHTPAP